MVAVRTVANMNLRKSGNEIFGYPNNKGTLRLVLEMTTKHLFHCFPFVADFLFARFPGQTIESIHVKLVGTKLEEGVVDVIFCLKVTH